MIQKKAIKFKLTQPQKLRVESGTENKEEMKSCFYLFSTHLKSTELNNVKDVRRIMANIKKEVYNSLDKEIFRENFIFVDTTPEVLNISPTGFVSGEFTFFTKKLCDKSVIENKMNQLTPIVEKYFGEHEKFTYGRNRK